MPTCPQCSAPVDEGARFCPTDGTPIEESSAPASPGGEARRTVDQRPFRGANRPAPPPVPDEVRNTSNDVTSASAVGLTIEEGDAASDDPLLGRVIDERWRVVSKLGAGGMGAVYLAEHTELRKRVAIKLLLGPLAATEEFRKRFEREARAASSLSHPNCVSVHDFGRIRAIDPLGVPSEDPAARLLGSPYLVMEYVKGRTLDARMETKIAPPEAILITRAILSALRHAHGLGLVHRDIKPGNIMLPDGADTTFVAKLLDFGLAKQMDEGGEQLTQTGMVCGTPWYLSPEQATGAPLDARCDLYSLGLVLFEMLCGRPPFEDSQPMKVVRDHIATDPPRPRDLVPSLSPELERAVLRALEKKPSDRFADADEMQAALAECPEAKIAASPPSGSRVMTSVAPSAKASVVAVPATSRKPIVSVAIVVVLLAASLGALALRSRSSSTAQPAAAPPAKVATTPPAVPWSAAARKARTLLDEGHLEEAVATARTALVHAPRDGGAHAVLGAAYEAKLWCSDAIDELEKAVRDQPALAGDLDVQRWAIACFHPKTQAKAVRFVVEKLGAPAVPALRQVEATDADPEIRKGAQRALEHLGQVP